MAFTILGGCFSYSNDKNVRECECTNGTYGSYYGCKIVDLGFAYDFYLLIYEHSSIFQTREVSFLSSSY